jgi:hypothetical protein
MKSTAVLIWLAGILWVVSGCASTPHVAFNKAASSYVKRIALLQVRSPRALEVTNLGGAGSAFGLIGAAVASADEDSKTHFFSTRL